MMAVSIDRESPMRRSIEEALKQAASKPGAPELEIEGWGHGDAEPELYVRVGKQRKTLEVSQPFLDDEPDESTMRKVAAAAREIVAGDYRRVQLLHRGVFAMFGGADR